MKVGGPAILETARLRLREFAEHDLEVLAPMFADEDQMRFYPYERNMYEAGEWIGRNINLYQRLGYGFWLLESVATKDFVGYCGIRPEERLAEIEMGWHISKQNWNQGLATEAAHACRDVAFDRFGLDRLVALIDSKHGASIRVAEKIGMHPETTTVLDGHPWAVYAIGKGSGFTRARSARP